MTSTVGLIVAPTGSGCTVIAAEFTHFIAKAPLHVAVAVRSGSLTGELITDGGPFTVTLCSVEQADIAYFVGSFSGREIDTAASAALDFRYALRVDVPWISGGVAALECVTRQLVDLPECVMMVGEVVHAHLPSGPVAPLVTPGAVAVRRSAVVAAAELLRGDRPVLRVAATGRNDGGDPFHVLLRNPESAIYDLGYHAPNESGDLLVDVPLPAVPEVHKCSVIVMRAGLKDGRSGVSVRHLERNETWTVHRGPAPGGRRPG